MRVHFPLCLYFFCFHRGPGFRAAENCKKHGCTLSADRANYSGQMHDLSHGWIFLYAFLRFHRNGIRAGKFSIRSTPQWGRVFPGTVLVISHRSASQISAPLVPLYHYSHWLRISLALNFGLYAFDAVSTSSSLAPEAEIRTKTLRLLPVINNNRYAKPKIQYRCPLNVPADTISNLYNLPPPCLHQHEYKLQAPPQSELGN